MDDPSPSRGSSLSRMDDPSPNALSPSAAAPASPPRHTSVRTKRTKERRQKQSRKFCVKLRQEKKRATCFKNTTKNGWPHILFGAFCRSAVMPRCILGVRYSHVKEKSRKKRTPFFFFACYAGCRLPRCLTFKYIVIRLKRPPAPLCSAYNMVTAPNHTKHSTPRGTSPESDAPVQLKR